MQGGSGALGALGHRIGSDPFGQDVEVGAAALWADPHARRKTDLLEQRTGDVSGSARGAVIGEVGGNRRADRRTQLSLGHRAGERGAHGLGRLGECAQAAPGALADLPGPDTCRGVGVVHRPEGRGEKREIPGPMQVRRPAPRPYEDE
nr:hypothetical protein [Rhodococcus aetherivorans]